MALVPGQKSVLVEIRAHTQTEAPAQYPSGTRSPLRCLVAPMPLAGVLAAGHALVLWPCATYPCAVAVRGHGCCPGRWSCTWSRAAGVLQSRAAGVLGACSRERLVSWPLVMHMATAPLTPAQLRRQEWHRRFLGVRLYASMLRQWCPRSWPRT